MDADLERLRRRFLRNTHDRLEAGQLKYGEDKWKDEDLLKSVQLELEDIANYSFLMWTRIELMRERIREDLLGHSSSTAE